MLHLDAILHPTDFSERSESALHLACALARDYNARVVILHVKRPSPRKLDGTSLVFVPRGYCEPLQEELQRLWVPRGVRAELRLEEGDAADEILRVAQEINADLIVLGTRARSRLRDMLLGSVAENVVRRATCPVVSVKSSGFEAEPAASSALEEAMSV